MSMNDAPWLRDLAQVSREKEAEERSRLDERWDRLSAGELTAEEEAELMALAGTSEEAREAYEAFRPLGPDFQARVVSKIRAQERKPKILFFPKPTVRLWSGIAATAAAAALVLLLIPPAPLPDYSLAVSSGVSASRGEETAEVQVLAPGDRFKVIVRPATEVSRGSRLEAFCVLARDRELRSLQVQSEIVPTGLVTMKGSLGSDIRPGTWTLWAVVGRPGKLPDPAALRTFSPRAGVRQRNWVAVPESIRIQPRDQPP